MRDEMDSQGENDHEDEQYRADGEEDCCISYFRLQGTYL